MGNGLSKEQEQYYGQIHLLLKASGCKVKKQNLINLLHIVKEYCPWFPNKGSLDLEIGEKVGQKLKWHQESGTPIRHQNLFTWGMVRTALTPIHIPNLDTKAKEAGKTPLI